MKKITLVACHCVHKVSYLLSERSGAAAPEPALNSVTKEPQLFFNFFYSRALIGT